MKEYMKIIEDDIILYCGVKEISEDICELISIKHI